MENEGPRGIRGRIGSIQEDVITVVTDDADHLVAANTVQFPAQYQLFRGLLFADDPDTGALGEDILIVPSGAPDVGDGIHMIELDDFFAQAEALSAILSRNETVPTQENQRFIVATLILYNEAFAQIHPQRRKTVLVEYLLLCEDAHKALGLNTRTTQILQYHIDELNASSIYEKYMSITSMPFSTIQPLSIAWLVDMAEHEIARWNLGEDVEALIRAKVWLVKNEGRNWLRQHAPYLLKQEA